MFAQKYDKYLKYHDNKNREITNIRYVNVIS